MDKSYVTMEQHQCHVCGKIFDTGALLLDTHLRNRFDRNTVTGSSLCPDCNKQIDDGFIIFIVVKDGETGSNPYRTGELLFHKAADPANKLPHSVMYIEESAAKEMKACHEQT